MSRFFKRSRRFDETASYIQRDMALVGDVSTNGVLFIDGEVHGHVSGLQRDSVVYVRGNGRVYGDITCPIVFVDGLVMGVIDASESLTVSATGSVRGTVYYQGELVTGARGKHDVSRIIQGGRPATEVRASAKHLLRDLSMPSPTPAQIETRVF